MANAVTIQLSQPILVIHYNIPSLQSSWAAPCARIDIKNICYSSTGSPNLQTLVQCAGFTVWNDGMKISDPGNSNFI